MLLGLYGKYSSRIDFFEEKILHGAMANDLENSRRPQGVLKQSLDVITVIRMARCENSGLKTK